MVSCKSVKALILFSLCLSMGLMTEDTGKNAQCAAADAGKIYYRLFDTQECITKDECKKSQTNPEVYLTGAGDYVCSNNNDYCQQQQKNKPGYTVQTGSDDPIECSQCPLDKPISNGTTCGQCPDKTIFTYVELPNQSNACVNIGEIQEGKILTGVFDSDFKIYYKSGYTCPKNQILQSITLLADQAEQKFNQCQWCPLKTPVSNDGVNCTACEAGFIPDEESHSCVPAAECKNILSIDTLICFKSSCPLGQYIDKSNPQSKCNTCTTGQFPVINQSQCVESCKSVKQVFDEKSQSCIEQEACEGFYEETDKNVCLKNNCQRGKATFDLPASIVLPKNAGQKYQVCQSCPSKKEFVQLEGFSVTNECKNCATDISGTISDFVSGMCITEDNIKNAGILDEEKKNFYPIDKYTCKSGYYLVDKKNSAVDYKQCDKCPTHLPVSDGVTCSNTCPGDAIADQFEGKCQTDPSFKCKGRLSSDGKYCSAECKPGDKILSETACEKCPEAKPFSSKYFTSCLSKTECYLDFEFQTCFDSSSDCEKKGIKFIFQKDSQICKQGCEKNEIRSKKNNIPICIDNCLENQFSYFFEEYQYCQDSCTSSQYAILDKKLCQDKTECSKFISGSPNQQCLEACNKDEVIISEKQQGQSYTECVLPLQCQAALVKQEDKTTVCTEKCYTFVNAKTKECVSECPEGYYQDSEKSFSNFFYCYEKCPAGKLHFISNGIKSCINKSECKLNISSDKTQCTSDCKNGEIALQSGSQVTCELYDPQQTMCNGKGFVYSYKNYMICSDVCNHIFRNDKTCAEKCPEGEHLMEKSESETFQRCSKTCGDLYSFVDENGVLICSQNCSTFVSADKKQCLKQCGTNEFINEKLENQTYQQCSTSCDKIAQVYDDNSKHCVSTCSQFLETETKTCVKSCNPTDFVYEKVEGQNYIECSSKCSGIATTNEKGVKICSKTCSRYISSDQKSCNDSCGKDEFILEKKEGETFFLCTKTCPESTYQYTNEEGQKLCIKECNYTLSSDKLVCQQSCPPEEFVNDKNDKTYYQCSKECKLNSYIGLMGIKICTSECWDYLSLNGKDCKQSCEKGEYVNDKNSGEKFYKCSTDCTDFEYDNGDNIKRCGKSCPLSQIPYKNKTQSKCLKTKKECPEVISINSIVGQQCVSECKSDFSEYPKNMNGFKECFACENFFNEEKKTCSESCGENEIGVVPENKCYSKEEGDKICKTFYLYTADKTKCVKQCPYPEIAISLHQCSLPCDSKDPNCKTCPDDMILFSNNLGEESCVSDCDEAYISSDKKRCVQECSYIGEQNPDNGKNCIKCQQDEILQLSGKQFICKKNNGTIVLEDKIKTAEKLAETPILSKDQFENIKSIFSQISKDTAQKISTEQSPQQLIDSLINIAKKAISNIGIPQLAHAPHTIGSKDNIIVQIQTAAVGQRFKTNFNINQIQSGNNVPLTEENLNEKPETISQLSASIIAYNPACKTDACKEHPLFQLDKSEIQGRRVLQQAQQFTVTFNLNDSKDINKYACLSYDLSNPTAAPTLTQTNIGNDNKSITCLVSGSVSIMLDSTCQFIDKNLCIKKVDSGSTLIAQDNDDDDLNGGEIAGIVIGVIAFVGIIALTIIYFIRARKSHVTKDYSQPRLNQNQHEQLKTEPLQTLGLVNPEKQL